MATCRNCRKRLEEISPGLYDECDCCSLEGMWQYEMIVDQFYKEDADATGDPNVQRGSTGSDPPQQTNTGGDAVA